METPKYRAPQYGSLDLRAKYRAGEGLYIWGGVNIRGNKTAAPNKWAGALLLDRRLAP